MKIVRINDPSIIAKLNEPVQELHNKIYPEKFKEFDLMGIEKYFADIINKEEHYFFAAVDDEELGYIWFQEVVKEPTPFSYGSKIIYINQISVNPNNKGKGIGKALVGEAIKLAKGKGIGKIGLDYYTKNELSKKIYDKMGFEVVSEVAFITIG